MTSIFKTASLIALTFAVLPLSQAVAQEGGRGQPFPFQGGEAIYKGVCQGCHMPDAKGATGAGTYPALANNPKLAEAGYPVSVIIHGQKAMPPLGGMLSDKQIADVVTYIRTHFGNHYTEAVNVADVKTAR
jgi:mono/diheme cytochrome c family protein